MTDTFIFYCACYLSFMLMLSLYRAAMGPTVLDRILGVNAMGSKTVAILVMIGILYGRVDMFTDIAIAYAMLNFLAVLAASRYFHKKKGSYHNDP